MYYTEYPMDTMLYLQFLEKKNLWYDAVSYWCSKSDELNWMWWINSNDSHNVSCFILGFAFAWFLQVRKNLSFQEKSGKVKFYEYRFIYCQLGYVFV